MKMTPIYRTHDVAARAEATRLVATCAASSGAASANPAACASVYRSDL